MRPPEDRLRELGREITTQDNRTTADPIFVVQERRLFHHCSSEEADGHGWYSGIEWEPASETTSRRLDALDRDGRGEPVWGGEGVTIRGWTKVYHREGFELLGVFFTAAGAEEWIERNGSAYRKPRWYAFSGRRSPEWGEARRLLQSFAEE